VVLGGIGGAWDEQWGLDPGTFPLAQPWPEQPPALWRGQWVSARRAAGEAMVALLPADRKQLS